MSFSQLDLFGKLHHGKKIIDFPFFFLFAEFSEIDVYKRQHAQLLKQSPTYRKMIEKSNLAEKFNY